jgi:ABC-2 type transport system ATP-binding protein
MATQKNDPSPHCPTPDATDSATTPNVGTPGIKTPSVSIEALTKVFPPQLGQPRKVGLDGVSLTVYPGETFGLLGPNGAGKTTLQKIVLGLMRPTSGKVQVLGSTPDQTAVRERVGYLPENPYFYTYLTGREFLHFCGGLFQIPKAKLEGRVKELLERVSMTHAADTQLRKYSKGMLQRIGVAQALVNDPELVFLDEPMSGLDPVGRKQLRDLILSLKAEGKTLFFNTHILSDVELICDRIGILCNGKLVSYGSVSELTREESLEDLFVRVVEPSHR